MAHIEQKLKELQTCLGERKLKQLGLIPCQTCREILTQVMNIKLPPELENKNFYTAEEMAVINQTILDATNDFLKETPPDHEENADSAATSNNIQLLSQKAEDATSKVSDETIHNEKELMSKLLSILNESQHISQGDLGIGYIYNPPIMHSLTNTLSCSECGHLYTIITQPQVSFLPLPVYLTDTEYEMIKGLYVDIFL